MKSTYLPSAKGGKSVRHERVVTTVGGSGSERVFEVTTGVDASGRAYLELRRLGWGNGVGWYCQQALRLDPQETTALKHAVRALQRQTLLRHAPRGKVLLFPKHGKTDGQPLPKTGRRKKPASKE